MFIYAEVQGFILYDRIRKGEHKLLKYVCETPSSPCTLSCRYLAVHKKRVNYDLCPEIPEVLNMKYELTKDTSYLLKLVRKYPYTPYALKGLNLKLNDYDRINLYLNQRMYDSVLKYADTTDTKQYKLYLIAKSKYTELTFDEMLKLPKWYLRRYIVKPLRKVLTDENYDSIEVYLKTLAKIGDKERAFRLMASEVAKPDLGPLRYRLYNILSRFIDGEISPKGWIYLGLSAYALGYLEDAYNHFYEALKGSREGDFHHSQALFWLFKITGDSAYIRVLWKENPLSYYSLRLGLRPVWKDEDVWDTAGDIKFYKIGKLVERIAGYRYAKKFYLMNIPSAYKYAKELIEKGNFYKGSLILAEIYRMADKSKGIPRWWGRLAYPLNKKLFLKEIDSASKEFDIDPLLFAALIREESRFKVKARSPAGAMGLSQIMPDKVRKFSKKFKQRIRNPYKPINNLRIGAWVFKRYLEIFPYEPLALASYNAGSEALNRWMCDYEYERLDYDLFVDILPYNETRSYLRRVMRSFWIYESLYRESTF